jgi:hypothetical protein
MDVALDSNILIADLWQNSQSFRFLMDYIEKTNSSILIPSVVDAEVKAHFKRKLEDFVRDIDTAMRHAERAGVKKIPDLDTTTIVNATQESWDVVYEKIFKKAHARVIQLDKSIVEKAVERAAYRQPPYKENGDGMRDAIIWLQVLDYCKERKINEPVAFISLNTHDFASQDKVTLRTELKKDVEDCGIKLFYYASLESFLKEQATPISHITAEWLAERIDLAEITTKIKEHYTMGWQSRWQYGKFKIYKAEYRDYYQIDDQITDINVYDVQLEGFIVWQFDDDHIELSLEFYAHLEGVAEAELMSFPPSQDYYDREELWTRRELDCYADLLYHFAAEVKGERVEIGDIEDVNQY